MEWCSVATVSYSGCYFSREIWPDQWSSTLLSLHCSSWWPLLSFMQTTEHSLSWPPAQYCQFLAHSCAGQASIIEEFLCALCSQGLLAVMIQTGVAAGQKKSVWMVLVRILSGSRVGQHWTLAGTMELTPCDSGWHCVSDNCVAIVLPRHLSLPTHPQLMKTWTKHQSGINTF